MEPRKQTDKITLSIPLGQILFLATMVLAILKLMGKISLNWIQVFAPLWIPTAAFIGVMVIFFIIALIMAFFDKES